MFYLFVSCTQIPYYSECISRHIISVNLSAHERWANELLFHLPYALSWQDEQRKCYPKRVYPFLILEHKQSRLNQITSHKTKENKTNHKTNGKKVERSRIEHSFRQQSKSKPKAISKTTHKSLPLTHFGQEQRGSFAPRTGPERQRQRRRHNPQSRSHL